MKTIKLLIPLLFFALIFGCEEKPPTMHDGEATIHFLALFNTSTDSLNPNYITLPNAKVILSSEYGIQIKKTDANGVFYCTGLPSSSYNISVRMPRPGYPKILLTANLKAVEVTSGQEFYDTVYAEPISNSGIAINEIYAGGPLNNLFFFYDQYIELYNSSDSVQYLDGFIVMRVSGNNDGKGSGADEDDDNDMDGVTYIFKFPGSPGEKNYPIQPGQFLTLASDAVNHKNSMSTSIDLSNASWEFYNQYSSTDIDNPNVPNLINLRSDRTVDFLINLVSDIIVVASGVDTAWVDGIDISTIIDGVEYQSNPTSMQTLDDRIDRGYALSPPKYSGQSMQRREPGEDTNDSSLDWEILPHPTPGYQK